MNRAKIYNEKFLHWLMELTDLLCTPFFPQKCQYPNDRFNDGLEWCNFRCSLFICNFWLFFQTFLRFRVKWGTIYHSWGKYQRFYPWVLHLLTAVYCLNCDKISRNTPICSILYLYPIGCFIGTFLNYSLLWMCLISIRFSSFLFYIILRTTYYMIRFIQTYLPWILANIKCLKWKS